MFHNHSSTDASAIDARLAVARTVAISGGELATDYFYRQSELVVETKMSAQDAVSQADRNVEDLIRQHIQTAFPEDGIIGEERPETVGTSGFTWVIDPIDGTSLFLAGLHHWCVSIAVMLDDTTVVGVIQVPLYKETFTGSLNQGAFLNGERLSLNNAHTIQNSLIGVGVSQRGPTQHSVNVIQALLAGGGMFYRNGSGALMLASVAAGRLGGYYENHIMPWDCLAGLLLIREAGGLTAPFCQHWPLAKGDHIIAAAPGVWDDLNAIVIAAEKED
ncbi:inositol monophosphatase [Halomonas sp. SpR1]|uniref:inositol monophosphatase family protein n=1 Tax=Halomonas sp. SpR1 TaxID=3050462 RepID=UPI0027E58897|nr:inositol monophosphatase [Halomonas sp. SpR1]MDQ7732863.1 inositol monophosphatase [Halomonas sp. SpR1]